jgi:hypothetical protein
MKGVKVNGQESLPAGISKVSIEDNEKVNLVDNQEETERMNTDDVDPSSTRAEPSNSLIPNFIELDDEDQEEAVPKFASTEQASSLVKLQRAEKDAKTLEKLSVGV